jgi:5-methyltetrahydropteroyltriglutamate--homocysteine methyltransferase
VSRSWEATESEATAVSNVNGIVIAKLSQKRPLTAHETEFLCKHWPGPIKITLPSAIQFPAISFKPGVTDRIYPNRSALLSDVVKIMSSELGRLKDDCVQYIQIDAPRYSC